jgi:hypothetical protein
VKRRLSESELSTPLWGALNATCYAGGFLLSAFHIAGGGKIFTVKNGKVIQQASVKGRAFRCYKSERPVLAGLFYHAGVNVQINAELY